MPRSIDKGFCPISGLTIFQPDNWKDVKLSERCKCSYFLIDKNILLSKPNGFAGLKEVSASMDIIDNIMTDYLKDQNVILMHDYSSITGFSESGREYYLKHKIDFNNLCCIIFFGISPLLKLGIKLGKVTLYNKDIYIVKDYEEAIKLILNMGYISSDRLTQIKMDQKNEICFNLIGTLSNKVENKKIDVM